MALSGSRQLHQQRTFGPKLLPNIECHFADERGAEVPRDAAFSDCADLNKFDFILHPRKYARSDVFLPGALYFSKFGTAYRINRTQFRPNRFHLTDDNLGDVGDPRSHTLNAAQMGSGHPHSRFQSTPILVADIP